MMLCTTFQVLLRHILFAIQSNFMHEGMNIMELAVA